MPVICNSSSFAFPTPTDEGTIPGMWCPLNPRFHFTESASWRSQKVMLFGRRWWLVVSGFPGPIVGLQCNSAALVIRCIALSRRNGAPSRVGIFALHRAWSGAAALPAGIRIAHDLSASCKAYFTRPSPCRQVYWRGCGVLVGACVLSMISICQGCCEELVR